MYLSSGVEPHECPHWVCRPKKWKKKTCTAATPRRPSSHEVAADRWGAAASQPKRVLTERRCRQSIEGTGIREYISLRIGRDLEVGGGQSEESKSKRSPG